MTTESYRFTLERKHDSTGVSGVGTVADGCQFPNGKIVVAWRGRYPSVITYDSVEQVLAVHGHGTDTYIEWVDPKPYAPVIQIHECSTEYLVKVEDERNRVDWKGPGERQGIAIMKCPDCSQLWRLRYQWDAGTGRDDRLDKLEGEFAK